MINSEISHLTVLPGPACNLSCSYCYLRDAEPEKTDAEAVLHGISAFIRYAKAAGRNSAGSGNAKITFLGGEPLLHGRNLKKWIIAARALSPEMPLRVFTNGTMLSPEWFSFFKYENVGITVSLDGDRECNDRFRRFRNIAETFRRGSVKAACFTGKTASVYDAVLQAVPLPERSGISACAVACPETAERLKENVLHIASLGFSAAGWAPDMSCFWPDSAIEQLACSAARLKDFYISEIKHGRVPFVIANMYETLAEAESGSGPCCCSSIALDAAGNFYPCDKLMAFPAAARRKYKLTGLMQKGNNKKYAAEKEKCSIGAESGDAVLNCGMEKERNSFFESLSRRGGKFYCNACLAGTLVRLDGINILEDEKQRIFKSQKKLSAIVRSSLRAMAEEGLKLPLFRKVHGYE